MPCAAHEPELRICRITSPFSNPTIVQKASVALLVVLFCCFCVPFSMGQVSASLSGIITDPSGAAVSGASIEVKSVDTGISRVADSDAGGRYRFFALPVG